MSRIYSAPITLLDDKAANGVSTVIVDGCDYRNIFLTIVATDTPTGTIKIRTADTDTAITGNASKTNPWIYTKCNDLSLAAGGIDGATGVAFTGTAGIKRVEVNTNGQRKLTVELTGYSAGKFSVYAVTTDNQ